jgi:hypothetical protein
MVGAGDLGTGVGSPGRLRRGELRLIA